MKAEHKSILRALTLEMRHLLEGQWRQDTWVAGDLEQRLRSLGVRPDGTVVSVDELTHLAPHDVQARTVIDAWLTLRLESGATGQAAVAELVRETAWSWATRLIALRCMEARGLIDDQVILTKAIYAGRSMKHNRLVRTHPELERTEDGGLFVALSETFGDLVQYLPRAFDPKAPGIALRPSVAAMTWCIGLLSGTQRPRGQEAATDEVFQAADALGWAYQYWNTEEKQRVFDRAAGKGPDRKRHKIERADIVPATQLYTEPYMVQFLVQNGLGGLWASMHPTSELSKSWAYFVRDVDRPQVPVRPVAEISFFDPACGSGHFLLEAFDVFFAMYREEDPHRDATAIANDILRLNLYGLDIDERAVHIAEVALWMKAAETAQAEDRDAPFARAHLAAANVRLPKGGAHLDRFLERYPQDRPLRAALEVVFEGLEHADELGSLLLLDEPVEAALRAIQAAEEAKPRAAAAHNQLLLLGIEAQGALPLASKSWESWRTDVLMRLREHFEQEAASADPVQAYFGRSVEQAFDVFDLLSRRYDVVAANPPYMGSKNMGPVLRKHVERHFTAGKRDLYAAFILRGFSLLRDHGRLAVVAQTGWMFLRSFAELRYLKAEDGTETGLLGETSLEGLVNLGPRAFSEIGGEVVTTSMFCVRREAPQVDSTFVALDVSALPTPELKSGALVAGGQGARIASPRQHVFRAIERSPLCCWLRPRLLELFGTRSVSDLGTVRQGMATADDGRFLRFAWEVPVADQRWFTFYKGGGYRKWDGLVNLVVDWQGTGARIKQTPGPRVQGDAYFFREGWTYSRMARGRMGVRKQAPAGVIADKGPGIYVTDSSSILALNSRAFSHMLRAVSPNMAFEVDTVMRGPVPSEPIAVDVDTLVSAKARLTSTDPTERAFTEVADLSTTLKWCADLHTLEGEAERAVMAAYGLDEADVAAVLADTGTPAGWLSDELDDASRSRVRSLFESGPGGTLDEDAELSDTAVDDDSDDNDDAPTDLGTGRPIHPETFLEELSEKAGVSPRAAWNAIQEGLTNGWRCAPEDRRIAADRVSVLVLRLLGHRWPLELEANAPVPTWADADGIVPLTSIAHEKPLIERLRERLTADGLVEAELSAALEQPLDQWLHTSFASHHTTQFKRRPVVWQIQSSAFTTRRSPAFAALLYCQKVGPDMLASVRSQYVGPLLQRRRQEVRTLEAAAQRDQAQEQQLKDLGLAVAELERFANALVEIERDGFFTRDLHAIAIQESVQSLIQPLLRRWQAELSVGPLPRWRDDALTVHKDLADSLAGAIAALPTQCAAWAGRVTPPRWEKEVPTASAVRRSVMDAVDRLTAEVRASLQRALQSALKAWMKAAKDAAKEAKRKPPKFTDELGLVEGLDKRIAAWTPNRDGLEAFIDDLPLFDAWCVDPGRPAPATLEDFVRQESAWRPDVNDGVRVNIAPLQRAGLLAVDALASKDTLPAIADRATWRADERRWVREEKLPRPGWWPPETP